MKINAKLLPKELIWILAHLDPLVLLCEPTLVVILQHGSSAERVTVNYFEVVPKSLDAALQ